MKVNKFVSGKCASLGCGNVVYVQDAICENCPNKDKTFDEVYGYFYHGNE